jgi:pimeloyl-ACP methyl ester carboxylesterase
MRTISGPIVLVGHSYDGAVITAAGNQVPNVKALVYLDALALEEGESNFDIAQADGTEGTDFYIDPPSVWRRDRRERGYSSGRLAARRVPPERGLSTVSEPPSAVALSLRPSSP